MTTSSSPTFLHDPDFYLPDGDLAICSAPSAQNSVVTVFRVHKPVMAYNSPVFHDMLELPAYPTGQETHEGVPLVRVTDSAEEMRALLAALYDPGSLSVSRWDPDAPLLLMLAMKLASKYEVDAVRKRVVERIEDAWPRSFEQWLRFHAEVDVVKKLHEDAGDGLIDGKQFTDRVPEPAAAIRIARDFDIPSILPFAYYTLATISLEHDWERYHDPSTDEHWLLASEHARAARWPMLDVVDMTAVLRGREKLVRFVAWSIDWASGDTIKDVLSSAAACCLDDDDPCRKKAKTLRAQWTEDVSVSMWHVGCPDPLGSLQYLHEGHQRWGLCELCADALQRCVRDRQETIWNKLSQCFEIE